MEVADTERLPKDSSLPRFAGRKSVRKSFQWFSHRLCIEEHACLLCHAISLPPRSDLGEIQTAPLPEFKGLCASHAIEKPSEMSWLLHHSSFQVSEISQRI